MTSFEMVCAALAHLETMSGQCVVAHQCSYRGENGAKCLIGALIPDELYDKCFEDKDAGHIAYEYLTGLIPSDMNRESSDHRAIPGIGFKKQGIEFLNTLQSCHDSADKPESFHEDVLDAIRRRCLTWGMDFPTQEEIDAHRGMTI